MIARVCNCYRRLYLLTRITLDYGDASYTPWTTVNSKHTSFVFAAGEQRSPYMVYMVCVAEQNACIRSFILAGTLSRPRLYWRGVCACVEGRDGWLVASGMWTWWWFTESRCDS